MLLRVRVLCCDRRVSVLVAILPAHHRDALPDQKDGNSTKGQNDDADDGKTVRYRASVAVLNLKETHDQMILVLLLYLWLCSW